MARTREQIISDMVDAGMSDDEIRSSFKKQTSSDSQQMGGSPSIGFVASQVSQMAPWNKANEAFKSGVGRVAEFAGNKGANPYATAALLTPVAIAPELLGAYASLKGINNTTNPTLRGLTSSPEELSPQYAIQNKVAGISNKVPETAGKVMYENPQQYPSQLSNVRYTSEGPVSTGARIPTPRPMTAPEPLPSTVPLKYPNDPGTLINQAESRIATHGENLLPQELNDYKSVISNMIDTGTIPQYGENGVTPLYARASQTRSSVTRLLNKTIDPKLQNAELPKGTFTTRGDLDKAYGIAKTLQKATKSGAKWGSGIAGLALLEEYARRKIRGAF